MDLKTINRKEKPEVIFTPERTTVYSLIENHYRQNRKTLVMMMRGMVGNKAEDAVQEGYANALQYWNSYDFNKSLDAWMLSLVRNAGRKIANQDRNTVSVEEYTKTVWMKGGPFEAAELAQVYKIIQKLPTPNNYVVQLAIIDGFTAPEIQAITGVKPTDVWQMVSRWRATWREEFGR